jgi:hypothetical protein
LSDGDSLVLDLQVRADARSSRWRDELGVAC